MEFSMVLITLLLITTAFSVNSALDNRHNKWIMVFVLWSAVSMFFSVFATGWLQTVAIAAYCINLLAYLLFVLLDKDKSYRIKLMVFLVFVPLLINIVFIFFDWTYAKTILYLLLLSPFLFMYGLYKHLLFKEEMAMTSQIIVVSLLVFIQQL